MLNIETLISDPYNRKARLQPALLTLLPILVVFALLVPEFQSTWAAVIGLVVYCGGATWLTQFGRDRGKALEPNLFQAWGGKPSVVMLRHRDARIPTAAKDRYRAFLERNVPQLKLATPQDEKRSPTKADEGYESATAWLLAQVTDRERFRLIFEENVNYGFRRNIWALKPLALLVDGLVIAAIVAAIAVSWKGDATSCSRLSISPHGPAACSLSYICSHSRLYTRNGSECRRKLLQNSYWRLVTSWAMTEKVEARRWYSKKRSDESVHSLFR